jgi:citrate synthase
MLDVALELERIALEDEYFVKRKLYPMRCPVDMFPVLFAIARTSGWLAQWAEMLDDPDQKIARPRQVYFGQRSREYLPIAKRGGQTEAAMG